MPAPNYGGGDSRLGVLHASRRGEGPQEDGHGRAEEPPHPPPRKCRTQVHPPNSVAVSAARCDGGEGERGGLAAMRQ